MDLQRAHQLFRQGEHAAARKVLMRLVKNGQHMPAALRMTGLIEAQAKNFAAAVDCFSSSLRYDASSVENWYYLGLAHQQLAQHGSAIDAFGRALALAPGLFEAAHNLGLSLIAVDRNAEALVQLDQAVRLNPQSFEVHLNRGVALGKLRRHEAEIESYEKALAIRPDNLAVLENLGIALVQAGQFPRAVAHYESLLARHPQFDRAKGALLFAKANAGDWRDFDRCVQAVRDGIALGKDCIDPFELLSLPGTAAEQRRVAERYCEQQFSPVASPLFSARGAGNDRIRVAYLSADFFTHATAFLLVEVLELHDRDRFEVIAVSTGRNDHSPMRRRLEAGVDRFIDAEQMSHQEIAQRIAEMNVDILVDLKGYTREARPAVLALRPAPVQVSYLGYPGTLGAPFIDYLVADRFIVPEDQRAFYSEKIIALPHSYQPNDSKRAIDAEPVTRAELGLAEDAFVFCNFNHGYKLTPQVFEIWMRLLTRVDDSVLWLMGRSTAYQDRLREEAIRHQVSPERLVFAPHVEHGRHLRRLQLADLFVDNLPYNAHTTASDALWAGLPLVTCAGSTFAGRVAGSLLTAAALPELIAESLPDYERLALALANDRDRLAAIRRKLETTVRTSALFDSRRYTRHLETGYAAAWARCVAGDRPDHIVVPS